MVETNKKYIYPFVDLIRFISMLGIVWAHTDAFPLQVNSFEFLKNIGDVEYFIVFKQIFKFSVVCFFMISGFLLGDNISKVSPFYYFKRRVSTTLKSFIAFLSFFLIFIAIRFFFYDDVFYLKSLPKDIYYTLFYTPYWFLPTYYIGLMVMLIFSKFVDSLVFGLVLLLITFYYTFSSFILPEFVIHDHTTAVFAFVFYIWLGAYIRNKGLIENIKRIPVSVLVLGVMITFTLACYQSIELFNEGKKFFFNNLRIFNQIYGLLFFLLLVRLCPEKPNFWKLNPRKETFGIYLYHFYFVAFIYPLIVMVCEKYLGFSLFENISVFSVIIYSLIHFLLTYLTTLSFVRFCLKMKWNIV